MIAHRGLKSLKGFFQRIRQKKGYKITIVALARKLLTIIHHLLTHQEFFEREENPKKKSRVPNTAVPVQHYDIQQMIVDLVDAGYVVGRPIEPGSGEGRGRLETNHPNERMLCTGGEDPQNVIRTRTFVALPSTPAPVNGDGQRLAGDRELGHRCCERPPLR